MNRQLLFCFALAVAGFAGSQCQGQEKEVYELPPNNYSQTKPHDAVTHLQNMLASGELKMEGTDREVVENLLRALHISLASQLLVFSKTSFQKDIISPKHPRALYFADDCYVGWVPGGLVEVAAIDPKLGPIFYSFDPRGLSEKNPPTFARDTECMSCHGGSFVPGIPAVFARSLYADKEGQPIFRQGSEVVDYKTPFSERWGGWYVTGLHGNATHRGNVFASENGDRLVFDPTRGANITNLSSFFDSRDYLATGSDIVSLLIFEQQTSIQNVLTRAGINCRHMLDYQKDLMEVLKPKPGEATNVDLFFDSVRNVFDHSADAVVMHCCLKTKRRCPRRFRGRLNFKGILSKTTQGQRMAIH
ncbi:MAG TPA: hypothetical protein VGO67_06590 [Verrucomicrobiae bacterium]